MAKLSEEIIVVKVYSVTKDSDAVSSKISDELLSSIEQVVQELVGNSVVVEVEAV